MSQNNAIQTKSLLSYYFDNVQTIQYNPPTLLLSGDVLPITMPYNNSSKSVMTLTHKGTTSYYTLNSLYISLNSNNKIKTMYQLIIEGNKNDYANNSTNKFLFIIPIFNNVAETIQGNIDDSNKLNNIYISSILDNIKIGEKYNYKFGTSNSDNSVIVMNQLLLGITEGTLYNNIIDSNTNIIYNIIQFNNSNIYYNFSRRINDLSNFTRSILIGTINSVPIDILNNNGPISTITESDIYIDCSPTNTLGETVAVYTSKNLDQLDLLKIDDINHWGSIIGIILILVAIIYFTIIMFTSAFELSKPIISASISYSKK
jgi:hypothetical protein